MKNFFVILFIMGVAFSACNEKDDTAKTPQDEAVSKWKVNSVIKRKLQGFLDYKDTVYGKATDYADFRKDGKVYLFIQGAYDTATYSIPSSTTIIYNGISGNITTLTKNKFDFNTQNPLVPNGYDELKISLKK